MSKLKLTIQQEIERLENRRWAFIGMYLFIVMVCGIILLWGWSMR